MSKRPFKAQASSSKAAPGSFGGSGTFGSQNTTSTSAFGSTASPLSYVAEPPDLSAISDPNVVVAFKNLSKKDSVTKARGLEELQKHISSSENDVEDAILEAWIQIYPRTSIDSDRKVRGLAHSLLGQIVQSSGKRFAKRVPKVVGAWLAGLYDNDRSVVKSVQESLKLVFTTEEKLQNLKRVYQQITIEYCRNVIDNESVQTLSDERMASADEAEAKYSRVIASCIGVITSLIVGLRPEDVEKQQHQYSELLQDKKLWDFSFYQDATVRKSVHRLLRSCILHQPAAISESLPTISRAYLSHGLNSDQIGSSLDYLETVLAVTREYPSIWDTHFSGKKTASSRLRQFLERGSQNGPTPFWVKLPLLFPALPSTILPETLSDATALAASMHGGIKGEPRYNLGPAYASYIDAVSLVSTRLATEEQEQLLNQTLYHLLEEYLRPSPATAEWQIPESDALKIVSKAMTVGVMPNILEGKWSTFCSELVQDMKLSAPEQSKEYEKSQAVIRQKGSRISHLQQDIHQSPASQSFTTTFAQASRALINGALEVLVNRNGKPFGAAAVIDDLLTYCKSFILDDKQTVETLARFVQADLPSLITSPSGPYMATMLYACSSVLDLEPIWNNCLRTILDISDMRLRSNYLKQFLTNSKLQTSSNFAASNNHLQAFFKEEITEALGGNRDWDLLSSMLKASPPVMADSTAEGMLAELTKSLSISDVPTHPLHGLEHILQHNRSALASFVSSSHGAELLQGLLIQTESSEEDVALKATELKSSIQKLISQGNVDATSIQTIIGVVQKGLAEASRESVSIYTLVDLSKDLVDNSSKDNLLHHLLPSPEAWEAAVTPFLDIPPPKSLSITGSLGGAVFLIGEGSDQEAGRSKRDQNVIARDIEGSSSALRIANYAAKLLKSTNAFDILSKEQLETIFQNLILVTQLANDNLSLAGANNLWSIYSPETEASVLEYISESQTLISRWLKEAGQWWLGESPLSKSSFINSAIDKYLANSEGQTPSSYYNARAYTFVLGELIELHGWNSKKNQALESTVRGLRRSKDAITATAVLVAHKVPLVASQACNRLCNELVAELTAVDIAKNPNAGLQQIVLLNSILHHQDLPDGSIGKQRVIFFVKHVVGWLQDESVASEIQSEVYKALAILLPLMGDMYGEHWSEVLKLIAQCWLDTKRLDDTGNGGGKDSIYLVHSTLRLYNSLRVLTTVEEPNDDLIDSWKETQASAGKGLINLLKRPQGFPDDFHQPLKIVNETIARFISKTSLSLEEGIEELYPLLYAESRFKQQAAFEMLHKQIPSAQEQISLNVVLDNASAQLPQELLSLILEAPTLDALADANFDRTIPLPLWGYLLSWLLVFDHFTNSSQKVRADYIDNIREGEYMIGLLDFMFDFLGHNQGKPVDIAKYDITTYAPDQVDSPERETQWLLSHIYFLSLKHTPSLAKNWWIDCKVRQKVISVESWTEKYVSSFVIADALNGVAAWASTQSTTEDETVQVKVNQKGKEVTASYEVDEQTMTIAIRLPSGYPLHQASVEGISRVAVDETKWQSWLRITQGVIKFSNGSIVDGIITWRRNVVGTLKGQSECAICYSIISGDKQLPSKRCGTCKNLFHSSCLYKWFKTSGGSSCPLCRNAFSYG